MAYKAHCGLADDLGRVTDPAAHECNLQPAEEASGSCMDRSLAPCRQLEVLRNSADGGERGSLLWLLDHTRTPMGGRLVRHWVAHPLRDAAAIQARLDAVEEVLAAGASGESTLGGARSLHSLPMSAQRMRSLPSTESCSACINDQAGLQDRCCLCQGHCHAHRQLAWPCRSVHADLFGGSMQLRAVGARWQGWPRPWGACQTWSEASRACCTAQPTQQSSWPCCRPLPPCASGWA